MTADPTDMRTARQFDEYMHRYPEMYRDLALRVRDDVKASAPVLLDIGSGSGLLLLELRRQYPQATVIGIEPLRTMLQLATENITQTDTSLHLIQGASEALPVCQETVDVVFSRYSLPYWPDPKRSFQEINRVLKPGGYLVLEALNKEFPWWRKQALRVLMPLHGAPYNVVKYNLDAYKLAHTRAWVRDMVTSTGLRILSLEGKQNEWKFLVVAQKT